MEIDSGKPSSAKMICILLTNTKVSIDGKCSISTNHFNVVRFSVEATLPYQQQQQQQRQPQHPLLIIASDVRLSLCIHRYCVDYPSATEFSFFSSHLGKKIIDDFITSQNVQRLFSDNLKKCNLFHVLNIG